MSELAEATARQDVNAQRPTSAIVTQRLLWTIEKLRRENERLRVA